jgi:carboxymethylenebutenolidase
MWLALVVSFAALIPPGEGQTNETMAVKAQSQISTRKVRFAVGPIGQGEEFTPGIGRPGSWPGIVIVPDSSGLNDTIRNQARSLASQGYLVLAVDLYEGRTPSSIEEADRWMNALPEPDTVRQIEGAIGFLQNWMMNPEHVGIVAWGMGGTYALRVAAHEQKLKAVVINYGPFLEDSFLLSNITSPVLINVGALDTATSMARIATFVKAMKIPQLKKEVKIYTDAGHNFEDALSGNDYKSADANDAEQRTVLFLAKWLKGR